MTTFTSVKRQLLLATLLIGGGIAYGFVTNGPEDAVPTTPVSVNDTPLVTKQIRYIQVGERVITDNPTGEVDLRFGTEVDSTWKRLTFKASKVDGTSADVVLLRPQWWVDTNNAQVGDTVTISVPECGIDGNATVLAIDPCPTIATGGGRVVTGTFHHQSARIYDVKISGQDEPIGATGNHPFWSETRQEFIRADELKSGENVRTLCGLLQIESVSQRQRPEPVHNIEVQVDHTYLVSSTGVLVHNPNHCGQKVREIALGKDIPGGGYKQLAEQTGASRWQDWAKDLITRRSVSNHFGRAYHQAAQRAKKIHFSLDGIDDVGGAIKAGRRGFVDGNMTNAELEYIFSHPELLKKTTFYRNGKIIPIPAI